MCLFQKQAFCLDTVDRGPLPVLHLHVPLELQKTGATLVIIMPPFTLSGHATVPMVEENVMVA